MPQMTGTINREPRPDYPGSVQGDDGCRYSLCPSTQHEKFTGGRRISFEYNPAERGPTRTALNVRL